MTNKNKNVLALEYREGIYGVSSGDFYSIRCAPGNQLPPGVMGYPYLGSPLGVIKKIYSYYYMLKDGRERLKEVAESFGLSVNMMSRYASNSSMLEPYLVDMSGMVRHYYVLFGAEAAAREMNIHEQESPLR